MSLHEYQASREIATQNYPFYALIFAAMRQADTANLALIEISWPERAAEFRARCDAPGGLLPDDDGYEEVQRIRREMNRCKQWSDPSDDFYGRCVHDAVPEHQHENEHGVRWSGDRWNAQGGAS